MNGGVGVGGTISFAALNGPLCTTIYPSPDPIGNFQAFFPGIPTWARKAQVYFRGVMASTPTSLQFQYGISSGTQTSGYTGSTQILNTATISSNSTFARIWPVDTVNLRQYFGIIDFTWSNVNNVLTIVGTMTAHTISGPEIAHGYFSAQVATAETVSTCRIRTGNSSHTFMTGSDFYLTYW